VTPLRQLLVNTTLSLAGQRLLPEGRANRLAAFTLYPLVLVMKLALGATLAFQIG
jgi:hypothetical protein